VQIPKNHQFSFGIQREIPWKMILDVSYIGSRTRNLIISQSINEVSARTWPRERPF
jgi:hypothetical protein